MDVRIGVTQTPKELEVELADDADADRRSRPTGRGRSPTAAHALAHRPEGPPGRRAGREGRLRRDRQPRRRPPHRLRRLTAQATVDAPLTCSTASCSSSPARAASARPPSPPRSALLAAEQGKRTLVCEVDAKGNLADFFETGPTAFKEREISPGPLGHVDEHRGVAQGVPEPPAEDPAASPGSGRWPAPSTSWPTPRPGVKEILTVGKFAVGGPGAPLRPRGGRRRGHRPHRRPAGRPAGHQRAGAGRPGPRPDRVDARHPRRPRPDRRGDRGRARGDAGQRDIELADRLGAETDVDLAAVVVNRVLPELFGRAARRRCSRRCSTARVAVAEQSWSTAVGGDVGPILDGAELAVTLRRTRAGHLARLRDELPAGTAAALRALPVPAQPRRAGHPPGGRAPGRGARATDGRPATPPDVGRHPRAAPGRQGDRDLLRLRRRGQDHHRGRGGRDGRRPPRRQGAGAHRRPGQAPGQRPRPRGVRQRRDPGRRRGVRRRRRRAPRRAVGRHARHQAVAGTTSSRRHAPDPATRDAILANPLYQNITGPVRPEPRLHRHGAALRDPRVGHATT